MYKLKQQIRTAVLYVTAVVLVGGVPMSAFAESAACKKADTQTNSPQWAAYKAKCDKQKADAAAAAQTPEPTASPDPATTDPAAATTDGTANPDGTAVQSTGNNDPTTVDTTTDATAATTDNNSTTLNNDVTAGASSGNAGVNGNITSGNAGTGTAATNATIVNSVQSTDNGQTGVATFTYDVNGNVVGDITIGDPTGPVDINNTTNETGTTNINDKATINNDVNVNATSGDASVAGNKTSGDATSGDANAAVNIINLIKTIIASNQSFVGTINIYGNLNGDILMSPEFIPQLLAANNGSSSTTSTTNTDLSTTLNDSTSIINNIQLNSNSGTATTDGNLTSGNATSGVAQTNLTILNLTGHTVNASNSLLVFVNVLGTWVGMIVDAPGSTAAALGSGVVSDTTNISSTTNASETANITNNVNLTAQTGNASVGGNLTSGNATSGNATASANIANISTSTFNLSGWFGVLFINVFGTWVGSFGVNTTAGTVAPLSGAALPQTSSPSPTPVQHFALLAGAGNVTSKFASASPDTTNSDTSITQDAVNAAAKQIGVAAPSLKPVTTEPRVDNFTPIISVAGFTVAGVSSGVSMLRRRAEIRKEAKQRAQQTTGQLK